MSTQDPEKEQINTGPESVLRLRKGHMPVTSKGTDSENDQYDDTFVLLADPPPSSPPDNVSAFLSGKGVGYCIILLKSSGCCVLELVFLKCGRCFVFVGVPDTSAEFF